MEIACVELNGSKVKYVAFGLGLGALAGLAGGYIPLALYLAPGFFGFALAAWGAFGAVPAIAAALAADYVLLGAADALYVASLWVPASLIIGVVIGKKLPWRSAVAFSALALGIALYMNMALGPMLAGENPFAQATAAAKEYASLFSEQLAASPLGQDEEYMKAALALFADFVDATPQIVMVAVCGSAMFFSLADVLIARGLCKAAKRALRPMTHFALWQLSKQYGYVALAAAAGTIAALLLGLANAEALFAAAACIVLMPLMLMGACYMEFMLRMSGGRRALRRAAFYAFALFLMPYSLILTGLMDRLMRVRRHYTQKKPNQS